MSTAVRSGPPERGGELQRTTGDGFRDADGQECNSILRRLLARVRLEALETPAAIGRIDEVTSNERQSPRELADWLAAAG